MKLLFDENLSFKLVVSLSDTYPESTHVRFEGLRGADELALWDFAIRNEFLIVSKDTDFYQRSILLGAPPKVVWLRIGNSPTQAIADLLRGNFVTLQHFVKDPDAAFLSLPP